MFEFDSMFFVRENFQVPRQIVFDLNPVSVYNHQVMTATWSVFLMFIQMKGFKFQDWSDVGSVSVTRASHCLASFVIAPSYP